MQRYAQSASVPDVAGCYYADRGSNRWGKRTEEEMRELHCMCGNYVVADNDEELVYQVLEHAREVHPEMDLTEEQAREMVTAGASDREDASDTKDTLY